MDAVTEKLFIELINVLKTQADAVLESAKAINSVSVLLNSRFYPGTVIKTLPITLVFGTTTHDGMPLDIPNVFDSDYPELVLDPQRGDPPAYIGDQTVFNNIPAADYVTYDPQTHNLSLNVNDTVLVTAGEYHLEVFSKTVNGMKLHKTVYFNYAPDITE